MRKQSSQHAGTSGEVRRRGEPAHATAQPLADQTQEPEAGQETYAPVPHRAVMERAFGLSFANVTARTGAGAALDQFGASAATRGTHVMFREAAPSPARVAHELTHVLQQRQPSGERGISTPGSAAEREATRNALRVDLGLAPRAPRERASPNAIYRDVKSDLREAMSGWGTDEEGIYNRLGRATDDEKAAVRSDPALMAELQDELTRGEWVQVLNLLGSGLETQIRESGSGWGTDEEGIYRAVESADAATLREMLGNGALLLYLRDELTDGELGRVLGSAANTMARDATVDRAVVFHTLVLFPDTVEAACDRLDAVGGAAGQVTNVISGLPLGAAMTPETISDVDTHIAEDGNKTRILASLTQRWDFGAGRLTLKPTTTTPGAADWSTSLIRQVHAALKMVPPEHVTQVVADITFVGIDPSLKGTTTGGYWQGGANVIGLNEDSTGIADTVRHEVGHSIDDLLENQAGDKSGAWKKNALNKWNWGNSLAIWENRMTDPWMQKDGNLVPAADQGPIRTAIENYAKTTDCTGALRAYVSGLAPNHVMLNYWSMDVPVIEAAKAIEGVGGRVWLNKGKMKLDGTTQARFTWKPNRNDAFLVFDNFVWQNVRNDYALSNHPEFFACLYEEYYAKGAGDERLKALNVTDWQTFFDTTVHGAR